MDPRRKGILNFDGVRMMSGNSYLDSHCQIYSRVSVAYVVLGQSHSHSVLFGSRSGMRGSKYKKNRTRSSKRHLTRATEDNNSLGDSKTAPNPCEARP